MARWKKPTREETTELRRKLAQSAQNGDLRIPEAVVEIRKAFGMTQEQFGAMLGMTRRQIADLETARSNPTMETLERIGKPFGFAVGFVPRPSEQDAVSPRSGS